MNSYKKPGNIRRKGFFYSVNAALEGVVHTLKSERNMRLHFMAAFLVLIAGVYFNLSGVEFMLLCFAVTFVLVAEMFNTAVEHAIDLISDEYHPVAKTIKDIAAGAVFVSAINAAIAGYILLFKRVNWFSNGTAFSIIKQSTWHITLIAFLVVVGLVLLIKVMRNEESLLRGGMPSGHAAVAFAAWTVISLVAHNALVSLLVLFLAVLIARSRMVIGIHSVWQVITGSILGVLTALLIFQLLS